MKYTKEDFLKAAELGEVSMIDARHIVSLLDEVTLLPQQEISDGSQIIIGEHSIQMLEISDEEIYKGIWDFCKIPHDRLLAEVNSMIDGAKWYREQLKKKNESNTRI